MKLTSKLKTSDKIALSFSFLTLFVLTGFIVIINLGYFLVWYFDQKHESMQEIDRVYAKYDFVSNTDSVDEFLSEILSKDILVLPLEGLPICSSTLQEKVHDNVETLMGKKVYFMDDKIYFIFSSSYVGVGEIKTFFDITPYIKSQIIIIKISIVLIFISILISFFFGKYTVRKNLRSLTLLCKKTQSVNLDNTYIPLELDGPEDDEIKILSQALNSAFYRVENQTNNLRQFISDVSHELKTPLMIIHSKIDLHEKKMESGSMKNEGIKDIFQIIRQNIKKINSNLDMFLFLSRLEEGLSVIVRKDMNLYDALKKVVDSMQFISEEKNMSFDLKGDKNIKIKLEEVTFGILIGNIVSNAIKFSPVNGVIKIDFSQNFISIEDNGVGMAKETKKNIFDKFYKKDVSREGFGVGLFIVKRIVKLYEWTFDLESEEGKGTKFRLNIK